MAERSWPFPAQMPSTTDNGVIQQFPTGATRSSDEGKNAYDGFLSMPAIEEFGDYMTRHRLQADGSLRDPDNWQKGMPLASYVSSLLRHTLELVGLQRGYVSHRMKREFQAERLTDLEFLKRETACAIWFNVQGFLHVTVTPKQDPLIGSEARDRFRNTKALLVSMKADAEGTN